MWLSLLFYSCDCLRFWKCWFRHSNTSLAPCEGSHWNKEKEFKALLPVWEEDRLGHQLWMQVQCGSLSSEFFISLQQGKLIYISVILKGSMCFIWCTRTWLKTELFLFGGDSSSLICHVPLLITPSVTFCSFSVCCL